MADRSDRCHMGVEKYVKKSFRSQRRAFKNSTRRLRRSRSKLRYYSNLKHSRRSRTNDRQSEDLCASFAVFDFTGGMDPGVLSNFSEVQKWQQQEQLAFWKAKAQSLEMENKMLMKSLRDIYAYNVENGGQNSPAALREEGPKQQGKLSHRRSEPKVYRNKLKQETKLPDLPQSRLEDMKRLYGSAAEKIMGMETATQLNYDLHADEQKLQHWPATGLHF